MRTRILLLSLAMLFSFMPAVPAAQAQAQLHDHGRGFSAQVQSIATDIADIKVLKVRSATVDGSTFTVIEAEITDSSSASLGHRIALDVPGGITPDGNHVITAHQPYFEVGDEAEVAVVRSTLQGLGSVHGDASLPVYSIVGGIDGVRTISAPVASQAEAAGDFVTFGTKINDFPATFYVNARNSGISSGATVSAVRRGFQEWEDDLGSDIDFTYGGGTTATGGLSDGRNTVYWTTTPNPAHSYLAQASWFASSEGNVLGFDVKFNLDYRWSNGGVAGRFDIGTVTTHEVGHALGFGHSPSASEIMYFQIFIGRVKSLGAGDASGAASVYPVINQDPARIAAANKAVDGFESYASVTGNYRVGGSGYNGGGQGWFSFTGGPYQVAIATRLSWSNHFNGPIPQDPNGRDFLVYLCEDRVGVFAKTDSATTPTASASWWANNGCTTYPSSLGYSYLALSAPT